MKTNDLLDALSPFHLRLDAELQVLAAGPGMRSTFKHNFEGRRFLELFELTHPRVAEITGAQSLAHTPLLVRHIESKLSLRGQILDLEDDGLVFLGTPWLTLDSDVSFAPYSNTSAPHEAWPDYVLAIQLLRQQQDDLKRAVRQLEARQAQVDTHRQFFRLTLGLLCTADSTFHFEELNPAWERVLGWSLEELRARPFTEFIHPDDLARTEHEASRLLQDPSAIANFENRYRHKDGRWVTLSWVVTACGGTFFSAARDVSAQKQVEQELRQFRKTLDQTQDGIFIFEPDTLRIVYANEGAASHVGYSRDELLAMSPLDLDPEFNATSYRKLLEPLIAGEVSVLKFETFHRHRDGHAIPVEVVLQYMAPPGEAPRFINVVRDISERKRVDKMKSEFISMVSHELRTPLTSIRGSLGLVSKGVTGPLPQQAQEYVDIALSNCERLVRLINDLLDIEKIQSGNVDLHLVPVDVGRAVERAVAANRALAAPLDVAFSLRAAPAGLDVLVDEDRFMQVMTNLLSNAVKFSLAGQAVELSVS